MNFTVNQLKKRIDQLVADGFGRLPVVVSKSTFEHNCEGDGVTILDVTGSGKVRIPNASDDGGTKWNKDGTESSRLCFMLVGSAGSDSKGNIIERQGE
jgi:hypothetical protein